MDYKNKYLKYKNKYLNLKMYVNQLNIKNIIGGKLSSTFVYTTSHEYYNKNNKFFNKFRDIYNTYTNKVVKCNNINEEKEKKTCKKRISSEIHTQLHAIVATYSKNKNSEDYFIGIFKIYMFIKDMVGLQKSQIYKDIEELFFESFNSDGTKK